MLKRMYTGTAKIKNVLSALTVPCIFGTGGNAGKRGAKQGGTGIGPARLRPFRPRCCTSPVCVCMCVRVRVRVRACVCVPCEVK